MKVGDSLKRQVRKVVQIEEKQRSNIYVIGDSEEEKLKEEVMIIITTIHEKSLELKYLYLHTDRAKHIPKKSDHQQLTARHTLVMSLD